jgi:hypothetical protein
MADMRDHYLRRPVIRGRQFPNDAMLWNGWHVSIGREMLSVDGWKSRLLGRASYEESTGSYCITSETMSMETERSVDEGFALLDEAREQNPAQFVQPIGAGRWVAYASLPEGLYRLVISEQQATWQRPRWPWPSRVSRSFDIEAIRPPMFAGKGENSWDCDDDAIFGMTSTERTAGGAVGDYVGRVLSRRRRYGLPSPENARPV